MSFNGKYWACNYGPGGNSADTINTPYKLRQKDACEDCPDTCDALTGLCGELLLDKYDTFQTKLGLLVYCGDTV